MPKRESNSPNMQQENKSSKPTAVLRYKNGSIISDEDVIAVEAPLEIRLSFGKQGERKTQNISVTMRTPGHDVALALGFLFTEGIISSPEQVTLAGRVAHAKTQESRNNIIQVFLKEDTIVDLEKLKRNFYTTSSCGVCGKESIDAVKAVCPSYVHKELAIGSNSILILPHMLREQQALFSSTGGIHAAAFFNTDGTLLLLREDVGRHNALDKLIGAALFSEPEKRIDPTQCVLLLSGRASFELIQKAAMAGVSIVCAVGAPSSLAVEMATNFRMTLIGFLREDRFNIYCGEERIRINK